MLHHLFSSLPSSLLSAGITQGANAEPKKKREKKTKEEKGRRPRACEARGWCWPTEELGTSRTSLCLHPLGYMTISNPSIEGATRIVEKAAS